MATKRPVKYYGNPPPSMRAWADKHSEAIEEVGLEYDDSQQSYWVYLRTGYIWRGELHLIHENTIREVQQAFRAVRPCHCPECQQLIVKEDTWQQQN